MTRTEFDTFVESAYQRGLTHVATAGGLLDISKWHPYGAFDGCNPGIERHIGGFRWINETQAADYLPTGARVCETAQGSILGGVWTFKRCAKAEAGMAA